MLPLTPLNLARPPASPMALRTRGPSLALILPRAHAATALPAPAPRARCAVRTLLSVDLLAGVASAFLGGGRGGRQASNPHPQDPHVSSSPQVASPSTLPCSFAPHLISRQTRDSTFPLVYPPSQCHAMPHPGSPLPPPPRPSLDPQQALHTNMAEILLLSRSVRAQSLMWIVEVQSGPVRARP